MYETIIPIDYATKDYEGFLQLMLDAVPTLLPEWTDLTESDFGVVLLQLAAYGLHVLSFYQDKAMNENFLSTAKNRESIIRLCRYLGYELGIQTASTSTVTFTKYSSDLNKDITIPAGTLISTDPLLGDVLYFETDEILIIPSGELSGSVTVIQGKTSDSKIIGIGNGGLNQEIIIEEENILLDSIQVYVIENYENKIWTKVDDFLNSYASDRHYQAVIDGTMYTKLTFGNGSNGKVISESAPVYATYRVGGGTAGNVAANKIVYIHSDISGVESVTNSVVATGGKDFESLELARLRAPKLYATFNRAVTKSDFITLAEEVDGVAKANLIETFNEANEVYLYIIPSDYGEPSRDVLTLVKDTIDAVRLLNCVVSVYPTEYVYYDVEVSVQVSSTQSNTDKKEEIEAYLRTVLDPQYYSHGESISISSINGAVHTVSGVRKSTINAFILDTTPLQVTPTVDEVDELEVTETQFLILNNLSVSVTGGI